MLQETFKKKGILQISKDSGPFCHRVVGSKERPSSEGKLIPLIIGDAFLHKLLPPLADFRGAPQ
jgi:hypothetical protein